MRFCPKCGTIVRSQESSCGECGKPHPVVNNAVRDSRGRFQRIGEQPRGKEHNSASTPTTEPKQPVGRSQWERLGASIIAGIGFTPIVLVIAGLFGLRFGGSYLLLVLIAIVCAISFYGQFK
jgi:hypothetical protein